MAEGQAGKAFYFEDYYEGMVTDSISYDVTKEEIIEYAKKWDPQPFHIDEELANASHFGGLTACSAHTFAIFCAISQKWKSGVVQQVLASLGFDELRMLRPVYAGDTLVSRSTVEVARLSRSQPRRGVVRSHCEMLNQNNEVVFQLYAAFLMQCREQLV